MLKDTRTSCISDKILINNLASFVGWLAPSSSSSTSTLLLTHILASLLMIEVDGEGKNNWCWLPSTRTSCAAAGHNRATSLTISPCVIVVAL